MATHSSILAWRIPWTEEPGRLQAVGSQRVRHDWVTFYLRFSYNSLFCLCIYFLLLFSDFKHIVWNYHMFPSGIYASQMQEFCYLLLLWSLSWPCLLGSSITLAVSSSKQGFGSRVVSCFLSCEGITVIDFHCISARYVWGSPVPSHSIFWKSFGLGSFTK